ncbi:MAG: CRISPR-associated exonuclease Cas4 [Thermoplasmata archaeon]|jgi:CRISPR-associated exonuclease Cas4|nr:CRISPR-associated exonuclease Cas4 [Thermoplasmata archaeon]
MPSAGEVEQFAYCAHNWWLARRGVDSATAGSVRGIQEHARGGEAIASAELDKKEYRRALAWAFRFLAMAGSVTVLALELLFLRQTPQHYLFLTLALVLVASSGGLLVIALTVQETYRATQQAGRIVPGHVIDSDLAGEGQVLTDPALGLSGKPDYVLKTAHGLVPVEVKTGQTPQRPYDSHALQVASYLHLLEANTGKAPEYGLLTYPQGTFRIGWDDGLRAKLKATLERMAAAEAAGKADRDHEQPGRCRGCARRAACDQRLA